MTSASTKRGHKRPANETALAALADRIRSDPPSTNGYAQRNAEIQRLRAAMVHAMDDAEWGAKNAAAGTKQRKRFQEIASRLKAALEKK
jgi:hypothetical protein